MFILPATVFQRFAEFESDVANTLQVLRYSALLFGIFYGFTHQRTITSNAEASKTQAAYAHKESLIEKAKAEWVKKTLPEEKKTSSGDSMLVPIARA